MKPLLCSIKLALERVDTTTSAQVLCKRVSTTRYMSRYIGLKISRVPTSFGLKVPQLNVGYTGVLHCRWISLVAFIWMALHMYAESRKIRHVLGFWLAVRAGVTLELKVKNSFKEDNFCYRLAFKILLLVNTVMSWPLSKLKNGKMINVAVFKKNPNLAVGCC